MRDLSAQAEALVSQSLAALSASDSPDAQALAIEIGVCRKLGLLSSEQAELLTEQARRIARHRREELRAEHNRELIRRLVPSSPLYAEVKP